MSEVKSHKRWLWAKGGMDLVTTPDPSVGYVLASGYETLRDERDRLRANLINCSERLAAYYGDNYPAVVDARAALTPAGGGTR